MVDKNEKSNFSKNLIKIRKEKGFSQEELAKLSGLTQRTIFYYENKIKKSQINNIVAIAKALNVNTNDLLGENKPTEIQNEFQEFDARMIKKIKLILSLPKQERHIIYSIVEGFLAKKQLHDLKKPS